MGNQLYVREHPISTYDILSPSAHPVCEQLILRNGPQCTEYTNSSSTDEDTGFQYGSTPTRPPIPLRCRGTQPSEASFTVAACTGSCITSDETRPLLLRSSSTGLDLHARSRLSNGRGLESLINSLCVYVQEYCLGRHSHNVTEASRSLANSYRWLDEWMDAMELTDEYEQDAKKTNTTQSAVYKSNPHAGTCRRLAQDKSRDERPVDNVPLPCRSLAALSSTCLTVAAGHQAQRRRGSAEHQLTNHSPVSLDAQKSLSTDIFDKIPMLTCVDSCLPKD